MWILLFDLFDLFALFALFDFIKTKTKIKHKLERIASTTETEKEEVVKCANARKGAFTPQ
jgi:hypothetical protein